MELFSDIPKNENKALTVSQLVRKMKRAIEADVGKTWIEGEVSNLRKQASGHWYFSLKDENSQIQCAMFSANRKEGSENLQDGSKVKVFADATVYEARGQLQLVVMKAEASGQGELQVRFEALKRKLDAEGLFDQQRKKQLPKYPMTIGIVTSPTGAVIQDITNVLRRRAPWVQPVLLPVRVQGRGVEREIANAIQKLNSPEKYGFPVCDILIVGRGGGSLEDLWCFNEEIVARAISDSEIPIISAVGHEIDFTIADFVADLRAPTPSAAAELAVPDEEDLRKSLAQSKGSMLRSLKHAISGPTQEVDYQTDALRQALRSAIIEISQRYRELALKHQGLHPQKILERRQEKTSELRNLMEQLTSRRLEAASRDIVQSRDMLRALGPDSAFKRGFSITVSEDGKFLRSAADVKLGMRLKTKLIDGEVSSTVS